MPAEIKQYFDDESKIVFVSMSGETNAEGILSIYSDAKALAQQHQTQKLCVDFRDFQIGYVADDVVSFGSEFATLVQGFSIARVIDYADFKHDMVEQVCAGFSLNLKKFFEPFEAINWLNSLK